MTKEKVLVVAAHSDDEALGCAGTLAKHIANGDTVSVMFMTNGVASRGTDNAVSRLSAAELAMKTLGVRVVKQFDFPDNAMDSMPLLEIVKAVEKTVDEVKPSIIYTHHAGDLNIDHTVTHRAVMTACRPMPSSCVKNIFAFEVLSSTEWQSYQEMAFVPNYFVDVTDYIDKKLEVVKCYQEEMREIPHSRSIEHVEVLMRHRGYSVGCLAAEAFIVVREIK